VSARSGQVHLAHQPELEGTTELEVVGSEVKQLLDPRARIEQRRHERVVAAPVARRAIDAPKDGGDLLVLQVLHGPGAGALEGEAQDALRVLEAVGMLGRDVPEEGVDGGQADIARRGSAVAHRFEVLEEGRDGVGVEVREVECCNRTTAVGRRESQEEREAIAVAQDRVAAHAAQPGEVLGEEGA